MRLSDRLKTGLPSLVG